MKQLIRSAAARLVLMLPRSVLTDAALFNRYQDRGIHIQPVHFYSPVPDTRELGPDVFTRRTELRGIDRREAEQVAVLSSPEFRKHLAEFRTFEAHAESQGAPLAFGPLDGAMLYHMVRNHRPRRIVEVGCGSSTRIIAEAIRANGGLAKGGYFRSIDPYPRDFIMAGEVPFVEMTESIVQDIPLSDFEELDAGDMLFIDSTHVVKINSDVVFEINEVFPRLAGGVHVHVHDIYLPLEYDRDFVLKRKIFWNEQYMLQAFLAFNDAFEITWSAGIAREVFPEKVAALIPEFDPAMQQAGSLWFRRKTEAERRA